MKIPSLASLSGLRIWHFPELWCGSQLGLRYGIAVAVAQAAAPIWPISWELLYVMGVALKKKSNKFYFSKLEKLINGESFLPPSLPFFPTSLHPSTHPLYPSIHPYTYLTILVSCFVLLIILTFPHLTIHLHLTNREYTSVSQKVLS